MSNRPDLTNVKIGDVFMRDGGGWTSYLERVVCEKITPKQAIIGGVKYWKDNSCVVGRDAWSRLGSLQEFNLEKYKKSIREKNIAGIRNTLYDFKWKDIDEEKLMSVWEIIK